MWIPYVLLLQLDLLAVSARPASARCLLAKALLEAGRHLTARTPASESRGSGLNMAHSTPQVVG